MSNIKEAYSEINMILPLLEDDLISKIPDNIKDFFENEKDDEYRPHIDITKPLDEQQLKRDTIILLTMLHLRYWCEDETEKQELMNQLSKNDKEMKKVLNQKYDFDAVLNQNKNSNKPKEEIQLICTKKNFIQRLVEKIKRRMNYGK